MTDYSQLHQTEKSQFDIFSKISEELGVEKESPVMLELGCATALYSKRFHEILNGKCQNICVELRKSVLKEAEEILPSATFFHGFTGARVHIQEGEPSGSETLGASLIYLNDLFNIPSNKRIDILHMDIQGAEVSVLKEMLDNDLFARVGYLFCSLHQTHQECENIINNCRRPITYLWNDPVNGGFGDGLIICKFY